MKTFFATFFLAFALLGSAQNKTQPDSTGLPGDNLDLNAVLAIFKDSKNPEDFEKKLNSADTRINNLDLNHDGQVDYLNVTDYGKGDSHSLVIRDHISSSESQDVAVIEAEKKGDKDVNVQIVGDEDLYGKDYIIEPKSENTVTQQQNQNVPDDVYQTAQAAPAVVYVNVWAWPCVNYMYAPGYAFWVSPWYWGYYPGWWSPWAPYGWWAYRANMYPHHYWYYGYRTNVNRNMMAHNVYYGHRASSDYVHKNIQISNTSRPGLDGGGVNNAPRRQAQMKQPGGVSTMPHTTSRSNKSINQNSGVRTAPAPRQQAAPRQFSAPAARPAPGGFGGGHMGGGMNRGMGGGHMGGGMRGGRR